MATHVRVPGFTPSVNGLHFVNSFASQPVIAVDMPPFGKIGIGDDPVGNADPIRVSLQPRRLFDRIGTPDRCLHVDNAFDVNEARLGKEVVR